MNNWLQWETVHTEKNAYLSLRRLNIHSKINRVEIAFPCCYLDNMANFSILNIACMVMVKLQKHTETENF